jgi:hypothetical protein
MTRPLTEKVVERAVRDWFFKEAKDWRPKPHDLREHGPDIDAYHRVNRKRWRIEVKGDPSGKAKKPDVARYGYFQRAIAQLMMRMDRDTQSGLYGLAFPVSYGPFLRKIPRSAWKLLRLHVFLVDENENVGHYTTQDVWRKDWKFSDTER